jgi:hypothetical protein
MVARYAGPRPHVQARRRPRQVRPGVYGFESRAARARPVRRRSGPHRIHSDGLRPRAWSTPTATSPERNENPMEPLVAGPATVGQPAKRRSPPSGEAVRRGCRTAPCRPTVPYPMARRAAALHRSSRLGAVLRNWKAATEAQASRHRQKSARARRTDVMRKFSGLGAIPPSRQFSRGQTVSDCSPRLLSP